MNLPRKMQETKCSYLFMLILIFSLVLYLYNITFSDLWVDETFTKKIIKFPVPQMFSLLIDDFHPPLYFLLLKVFTSVTGDSDFALRLFSIIGLQCNLIICYRIGQRVFGKKGALVFCLLITAIPQMSSNSHDARMYTWASLAVTGVFLYACLYMREGRVSDLIGLSLFTLMSAYTHYYSLIAAFWANAFVLIYIVAIKKRECKHYLTAMAVTVLLFLPWLSILLRQTGAANKNFYIPPLDFSSIITCYTGPFMVKFWFEMPSYLMILIVYGLTLFSVYKHFIHKKDDNRLPLGLALVIFNATILTGIAISFILRPVMMVRYVGTIITMMMVPPVLFFTTTRSKTIKTLLLSLLVGSGIYITVTASHFSYGPYRQCLETLHTNYPDIKKIVHVTEVSTGPLLEHNEIGNWDHYWIKNSNSVYYLNLEVFNDLNLVPSLNSFLSKDEIFCLADMEISPLNRNILESILSDSRLIKKEVIYDNKSEPRIPVTFYILQYQGEED